MKISGFNSKNILILGLGKTGISLANSLLASGATIYLYDDNKEGIERITDLLTEKFEKDKIKFFSSFDDAEIDYVAVSPGIPNNKINKHTIINKSEEKKIPIISDVELLQIACPNATYVGVTGTNGKSTTVTLIGHILKTLGRDVQVCGNVGNPVLECLPFHDKSQIYVIELSSYQLDLMKYANCDVGIFINLTPDHMDHYVDLSDYANSKKKIFSRNNLKKNQYNLISLDYPETKRIYGELSHHDDSKNIAISCSKNIDNGISIINNKIHILNCFGVAEYSSQLPSNQNLLGKHNLENIAFAIGVCLSLGCNIDEIIKSIETFEGLPHRMEVIFYDKNNNILFINDSKATNNIATKAALKTFHNKKIYWIVGGICKDDGIVPLAEFFPSIACAYLIGKSSDEFKKVCIEKKLNYCECITLENALNLIFDSNFKDCLVLLSPACASLDQWKNFEERGDFFRDYVLKKLS